MKRARKVENNECNIVNRRRISDLMKNNIFYSSLQGTLDSRMAYPQPASSLQQSPMDELLVKFTQTEGRVLDCALTQQEETFTINPTIPEYIKFLLNEQTKLKGLEYFAKVCI